jgi:hypothetical protein
MREDTETRQEQVQTKAYTLYPRHSAIIEHVAKREHRNFSNALQVILERYVDDHASEFVYEDATV